MPVADGLQCRGRWYHPAQQRESATSYTEVQISSKRRRPRPGSRSLVAEAVWRETADAKRETRARKSSLRVFGASKEISTGTLTTGTVPYRSSTDGVLWAKSLAPVPPVKVPNKVVSLVWCFYARRCRISCCWMDLPIEPVPHCSFDGFLRCFVEPSACRAATTQQADDLTATCAPSSAVAADMHAMPLGLFDEANSNSRGGVFLSGHFTDSRMMYYPDSTIEPEPEPQLPLFLPALVALCLLLRAATSTSSSLRAS